MSIKNRALIEIVVIYLAIAASGYVSLLYSPFSDMVLAFLFADVIMTVVSFLFSLIKNNSSVYDAYWSVIPFLFIVHWFFYLDFNLSIEQMLLFLVVSFWSWRLTLSWARGWKDFSHEDWRYVDLKNKTGIFYSVVNFLGIHLFPTILVFAGMWPLFYALNNKIVTPWLFYVGLFTSLLGTLLEMIADNQLAKFKLRANPKKTEILDTGIWGRSRNPNYLGEILFWVGVAYMGLSFGAPIETASGAVAMVLLFLFISIPMKEKRFRAYKPGFEAYRRSVPKLIPSPFKLKR